LRNRKKQERNNDDAEVKLYQSGRELHSSANLGVLRLKQPVSELITLKTSD
jgi:hypothetical protein